MEKITMLKKPLSAMGLNIKPLFLVLFLYGCFQVNPDIENQIWIQNDTSDTLFLQVMKRYINDIGGEKTHLYPGENSFGGHTSMNVEKLIKDAFGRYRGDTVEIYRNGVLEIKWAGPVRNMPDSVNHIFNINSWHIEMGGRKNAMEIGTFTISESDFVKQVE